ncbi:hypothetical protein Fcan01_15658 [Folsomia candida]|uniref:Chitin-binding type-2 domain-containing protein n=1 Tax=Folsomia candida TaxID=158441 RepID=A0A226DXT1_FOLCA|nr:hypothetical protein Fcan01_15658 [Folsomia candida]
MIRVIRKTLAMLIPTSFYTVIILLLLTVNTSEVNSELRDHISIKNYLNGGCDSYQECEQYESDSFTATTQPCVEKKCPTNHVSNPLFGNEKYHHEWTKDICISRWILRTSCLDTVRKGVRPIHCLDYGPKFQVFGDLDDCKKFRVCTRLDNGKWNVDTHTCLEGMAFNKLASAKATVAQVTRPYHAYCVREDVANPIHCAVETHSLSIFKSRGTYGTCQKPGQVFPDAGTPGSCVNYVKCKWQKDDGGWEVDKFTCSNLQVYSPLDEKCVATDAMNAPRCEIPKSSNYKNGKIGDAKNICKKEGEMVVRLENSVDWDCISYYECALGKDDKKEWAFREGKCRKDMLFNSEEGKCQHTHGEKGPKCLVPYSVSKWNKGIFD